MTDMQVRTTQAKQEGVNIFICGKIQMSLCGRMKIKMFTGELERRMTDMQVRTTQKRYILYSIYVCIVYIVCSICMHIVYIVYSSITYTVFPKNYVGMYHAKTIYTI